MFKKILFATDNTEHSRKAQEYVADLGKKYDAEVLVFNAYYFPGNINSQDANRYVYYSKIEENLAENSKSLLARVKHEMEEKGVKVTTIQKKAPPGPSIVELAETENCDLVITGTRGLGTVKSALINSVSNYVIHHAKCPVMLVN